MASALQQLLGARAALEIARAAGGRRRRRRSRTRPCCWPPARRGRARGRVARPERGIGPAAAAGRESRVRNCPCRWWSPPAAPIVHQGVLLAASAARPGPGQGGQARAGIGPAAAAGRESRVRNCPCRWWSPPAAAIAHQGVLLTAGVSRAAMAIDPRAANKKAR